MYCWRPVTVFYSWHYRGYFFLQNKTIFVSWKGNVLSVAISSQQLLLARAKGEKRGGFYFSDIGKNNLSFTVLFQDRRAYLKVTVGWLLYCTVLKNCIKNKGYRRYPHMSSAATESAFLRCTWLCVGVWGGDVGWGVPITLRVCSYLPSGSDSIISEHFTEIHQSTHTVCL